MASRGPQREHGADLDRKADAAAVIASCAYASFPVSALTRPAVDLLRAHNAYRAFRRIAAHHLALAPSATPGQIADEMLAEVEAARAERRYG